MPMVSGQNKVKIIVPDVTGMTEEEAITTLSEYSLRHSWNSEGQYSATIPKGAVMLQMPVSGKEVKAGRTVRLKVSKGLREVIIPNFRGKSRRQVEISLHQLGLKVGKTIRSAHSLIPRGVIIRTIPEAQSLMTIGSTIDLVVSSSRKSGTRMLPNVIGLSYHRAAVILDSLDFIVGDKTTRIDTTSLPLTVLEQHPQSGEYLKPQSTIQLIVAE